MLSKINYAYIADLSLQSSQILDLAEQASDWCHTHGLVLRTEEYPCSSEYSQFCPLTLFPTPFPRRLFEEAVQVQKLMAELYFKVSWDYNFLVESLAPVIETDYFTQKLMEIFTKVHEEGIHQKKVLVLQRADYMPHISNGDLQLKQIEVNNLAALPALGEKVTGLHKYMLHKVGFGNKETLEEHIPKNAAAKSFAKAVYEAWKAFGDSNALVLVVVTKRNRFRFDFRHIEYELDYISDYQCQSIFLQTSECVKRLSLSENYTLLMDGGDRKVGVVYFHAYVSGNVSEEEWALRLLLERSTAIKSPWIGLQLANTKKIQQVLSNPGVVERYLNLESAKLVRATFALQWGLDINKNETNMIVKEAINNPDNYVLKSQSEGGGKLFFSNDISNKLKEFTPAERAAHILQEKLNPFVVKNYMLRPFQKPILSNVVTELGIYGCLLGQKAEDKRCEFFIDFNLAHGHMIRTKDENSPEGGIKSGGGVIDSPFLI